MTLISFGKSSKNIPCFFSKTRVISKSLTKYFNKVTSAVSIPPTSSEYAEKSIFFITYSYDYI